MTGDRKDSSSRMDPTLKFAIGVITTVVLTILAYYLLPAGFVGISMFCSILLVGLILGFWFSVDKTLRAVKEMVKDLLPRKSLPTKSGNPTSGNVFSNCKWMGIHPTDEACNIYVYCKQNLMVKGGCPDDCNGYEEHTLPTPSGTGALGGMVSGGLIGLAGGPVGVILGGIIGGVLGNAIEDETITEEATPLNAQIKKCEEEGRSPNIYVQLS